MTKQKAYIKCWDETKNEVFQVQIGPRKTNMFITKQAEGYQIDLSLQPFLHVPIRSLPRNVKLMVY